MPVLPPESPLIGRDELLDTLLAGLRMRNSPTQLIVGPEGSGKTAIASGLAKKLHEVQTGPLAGYTISLLTAEEILQAESASGLVVEAVEKAGPRSVLFIDDLDAATLIGSELGTRTDLLVALRTAINRPDRHLILTISHPYAEKLQRVYPEFVDELQLVDLPPLSAESLQLIANRQAKKLAWFHRVEIDDDVVATACQAPSTQDRLSHPALALRRLDRAAATAAHNGLSNAVMGPTEPQLRFDQVAVAQGMAGRVKGQDHVIKAVVDRLSISRTGVDLRPGRPDGVFILAGPTGVGKSEFALALAEQVYGSEDSVIRLDMSEYRSEHEVARLVGPPPGYKGSDRPEEWLTTKIIDNPNRVLLLDEFEKADPVVWQTFLQVFDAGRLTDGRGRVADFRDTIVLLTSNIGAETFTEPGIVGFGDRATLSASAEDQSVLRAIKTRLSPELINRFDQILVFRPLTKDAVAEIARTQIDIVQSRISTLGYSLRIDDSVIDYLASRGYSREYGARPLQRVIEQELLIPISRLDPGEYTVQAGVAGLMFPRTP